MVWWPVSIFLFRNQQKGANIIANKSNDHAQDSLKMAYIYTYINGSNISYTLLFKFVCLFVCVCVFFFFLGGGGA